MDWGPRFLTWERITPQCRDTPRPTIHLSCGSIFGKPTMRADIRVNGTLPSAQHFIDMATVFWNKCMGNVDTVWKVIHFENAKHGADCGLRMLYWLVLLD